MPIKFETAGIDSGRESKRLQRPALTDSNGLSNQRYFGYWVVADPILHAVTNDTFHRNPKRKRGQQLRPSLTLRVTARFNRV